MRHISSRNLATFFSSLPKKLDFLIIGEMHGSKQNASTMQKFLQGLPKHTSCAIAFEWALTSSEERLLRSYVHGGSIPKELPEFFLDSDGRFTVEHLSLLRWIRSQNRVGCRKIDIRFFDHIRKGQDPDRSMARLLAKHKDMHPESIIIVETGNWHARRGTDSRGHNTMTDILSKTHSVFSIFLHYKKGKISIDGKRLDVTRANSQRKNPDGLYDAVMVIPICTPAEPPRDLTNPLQLLR